MMDSVSFNGYSISDFFQVIDVKRPIAGRANTTKSVSGMDGVLQAGSSMTPVKISVTLIIPDMTIPERREKIRELSYMLNARELSRLEFGSDSGLWYKAILDGESPIAEHVRSDKVTVNFTAQSPILYGEKRTVTVPSGGSVQFMVGGSYPTRPTIEGDVTGDSTANYSWGLRLDEGDYFHVRLGGSGAKHMFADLEERSVTVTSSVTLPTMNSDWLSLSTGIHTLRNDLGSGECVVTFYERWA